MNGSIESESDLIKDLEHNPVPYMMLITGSAFPLVQNGGFEVLHVLGEINCTVFDTEALKKKFKVEYAEGVFKLSDPIWSEFPHFVEAYYDEQRDIMLLSALTDHGYIAMAKKLHAHGFNLPVDPDIRLHLQMSTVIKQLLKKDLQINPYSQLFETKPPSENDPFITKLNQFIMRALTDINAGKEPDIDALAKETGIDPDTARDVLQQSMAGFRG